MGTQLGSACRGVAQIAQDVQLHKRLQHLRIHKTGDDIKQCHPIARRAAPCQKAGRGPTLKGGICDLAIAPPTQPRAKALGRRRFEGRPLEGARPCAAGWRVDRVSFIGPAPVCDHSAV